MVAMMAASAPRASADVSASRNTSRRTRLSGVALDIDIAGRRGSLADGEIRRWVRSMAATKGDVPQVRFAPSSRIGEYRARNGSGHPVGRCTNLPRYPC